ncbi:MAG: HlyC/CorC family transporter [Desulfamplus sp.]|nr:HlyC/CorC family transporter [Desulfamplus sp.]
MFFEVVITLVLVLLNGFFVASEFAIVKIRASQLELKAQSGNSAAILSKHIVLNLDGYLAATQLGITLASLGLGWIGEPVVSKIIENLFEYIGMELNPELAHDIALPIAFTTITVLHIVFGELAPKSIAIQRSESTTLLIAYPLQFFFWVFRPFIWVLNGIANFLLKLVGLTSIHGSEVHSSEELKYLVEQGKESGVIEPSNYKIIKNAFDFSEQTAKQIMIPRMKVFTIDVNNFTEIVFEKAINESYTRIPCYEENLDNIIGVVYLKDILLKSRRSEPFNIRDIMRDMMFVPETKRIGQLLNEFQLHHQQIAGVINEYGGFEGIITMEDILEELVGEIQDEYDNEMPVVEKTGDKTYTVVASATLDDINELLPHPIIEDEKQDDQYETLAGYLIFKLGKIPNVKDKITFSNYEFTILKKNRRSLILVQLTDLIEY